MNKRTRLDLSLDTLAKLQEFADYEGHGSTSAALATLVKHGLPLLMNQRLTHTNSLPVAIPEPQLTCIRGFGESSDPIIERIAGLLEEF